MKSVSQLTKHGEYLDEQLENLKEMARFIAAHISAAVLGDERALVNRPFVERIDLNRLRFDLSEMHARYASCKGSIRDVYVVFRSKSPPSL